MILRPFLIILLCALPALVWAQEDSEPFRIKTVVIDAGHGGRDPGNLGTGRYKWREKDVALDVALRTGQYIKEQFPEINVIYTRETDVFIGLNDRADIANSNKADIFISIHCNAIQYPSARGVETYALGLHKNEENLQVAMKENAAIKLEEDYEQKYEGFDPNSPESIIALTMMQSAFLDQSLRISSYIQKQFKERVGRRDRGVKQAGFLVLRRTTMPSILIELGFLTNPDEEDFLNSESGRIYMASAILRGFKEYKTTVEDPIEEGTAAEPKPKEVEEPKEMSVELRQAELRAELERKKAELAKQKGIDLAAEEAKKAKEDSLRLVAEKQAAAEKAAKEEADRKEAERLAEEARLKELADAEAKRLEQEAAMAEAEKKAQEEAARIAEEQKQQEAAAEAARLAEEQKQQEEAARLAEEQRLAAEKAEAERLAEEQRLAAEKAEAERKAEEERIAAEKRKAEQEKLAKEEEAKETKQAEIRDILESTGNEQANLEETDTEAARIAAENAAKLEELRKKKAEVEARLAKLKEEEGAAPKTETKPVKAEVPKPATPVSSDNSGLIFRVQIHTATKSLDTGSSLFRDVPVWEYEQGGLYKYTTGEFRTIDEATPTQARMRDLGFKGAFVVAFKDGQRIKVSEARKLLNN